MRALVGAETQCRGMEGDETGGRSESCQTSQIHQDGTVGFLVGQLCAGFQGKGRTTPNSVQRCQGRPRGFRVWATGLVSPGQALLEALGVGPSQREGPCSPQPWRGHPRGPGGQGIESRLCSLQSLQICASCLAQF